MSRKAVAEVIALNALQGWFAPVPTDMDVSEVLAEMPEMGGLHLAEDAKEIAKRAQRMEGSRITHIAVNVVDGDIMMTMLCDLPEEPLKNEDDLFRRDGYVFAYVYNNSYPHCSEFGDVIVEKQEKGRIRRIG